MAAYFISSARWKFLQDLWLDSYFLRFLTSPIFHISTTAVTPTLMLKAAVFVVFLGLLSRVTRRLLEYRLLNHTLLDTTLQYAYARITSYIVFIIRLVVGLESAGVNLNSLFVVGGADRPIAP